MLEDHKATQHYSRLRHVPAELLEHLCEHTVGIRICAVIDRQDDMEDGIKFADIKLITGRHCRDN